MNADRIAFVVFTIVQIPTVFCALQIFVRWTQKNSSLRRVQNRTLIVLLFVSIWTLVIELPHTQKYLWTGNVTINQRWFCFVYNISFFSNATLNRFLMAFMTIERHFLVFRPQLYRTHRSRFLFHSIPLTFIFIFVLFYVIFTNLFATCSSTSFDYSSYLCGYTCGILNNQLGVNYAWLLVFLPTTITVFACISLPIRFLLQRQQLQRVEWNRSRKLIVQMSIISTAYLLCWLPYTIFLQFLLNGILSFTNIVFNRYLSYTPYVTSLLTPWIVLHTSPEWFAFRKRPTIEIQNSFPRLNPPQQQIQNNVADS